MITGNNRMEMIMNGVASLLNNCPAYKEFHDELSKAANHNLIQHSFHSVNQEYTFDGDVILKLQGRIDFLNSDFQPLSAAYTKARWYTSVAGQFETDPYPTEPDNYTIKLHKVAKHIIDKYGKYMVEVKFGPEAIRSDRFRTSYIMNYTWNYIIP